MTISEAKREFNIRYYLWGTGEFEREIAEGLPSFQSFKTGPIWQLHYFIKQLDRHDQLALAHCCLKRLHADAVKTLAETLSVEEEALYSKLDSFWRVWEVYYFFQQLDESERVPENVLKQYHADVDQILGPEWQERKTFWTRLKSIFGRVPPSSETVVHARRRAGEKIKFASKRKLRKVLTGKFKDAFGSQCLGLACVDEDPELEFKVRCDGWIINTFFDFGRHETALEYSHNIVSESSLEYRGNQVPMMIMGIMISFAAWLGISGTQWEYLMDEDIEPTCSAAVMFCGRFFGIVPKLLKGLEAEKIFPDSTRKGRC